MYRTDRLAFVLALLLTVCTMVHAASPLTQASIYYSNEIITTACVVTAILGAYLAAYWKPPTDLANLLTMNSNLDKFLLAIAGGIVAFLYALHTNNRLTVLHPVWVLCVAVITPVSVQIAFPSLTSVISQLLSKFIGKKGE